MKKMKKIDIAVAVIFVIALIVIYFFWGCILDLYVTILAAVIILITGVVAYKQHKKLDQLDPDKKQNSK